MKKIFCIEIITAFFICLIACGGNKSETSAPTGSSTAESTNSTAQNNDTSVEDQGKTNTKGKLIYKQYCTICHGSDGKLGVSNATDLSKSVLPKEERVNQVTNGKGLMTPFKDILSAEQIDLVTDYIEELRK